MDEITSPQSLEYIIAIVTGVSIPIGIAYIGSKIRDRFFDLEITTSLYNDGLLDEKPTFWNIGKLSPFKRNSQFYKNKSTLQIDYSI